MVSSKLVASALVVVIVSVAVISLQMEFVSATFLIFLACLFFAYAGGGPTPGETLWARHGEEKHSEKGRAHSGKQHSHGGSEHHSGHGEGHAHGGSEKHSGEHGH